ncbi:uncharacterized protein LOC124336813 isoform X2 [Daphnia pulicaria]|uniref:uncharacterized protein LOC124336813 isoform X2 n=1 Tax=Daphnia pulicaria TaxID=35523 RepID=UPI001EEC16F3|nr:uncharacterized protein LOC124336813 isoform X2 [Daphnia pulicaria]
MTTVGSTFCWKALILILVIGNSAAIVWNGDGTNTRWALQCDFIGRDFKNQISPGDRCGSLCKENSPCSHFTWTNYNGGTCWMKSGYVSEFDAVSKTNDGAVCGFLKTTWRPLLRNAEELAYQTRNVVTSLGQTIKAVLAG